MIWEQNALETNFTLTVPMADVDVSTAGTYLGGDDVPVDDADLESPEERAERIRGTPACGAAGRRPPFWRAARQPCFANPAISSLSDAPFSIV